MCEELLLTVFSSASGSGGHTSISPVHMGNYVGDAENIVSNMQGNMIQSEAVSTLPSCSACDSIASSVEQNVGDDKGSQSGGLNLGFSGNGDSFAFVVTRGRLTSLLSGLLRILLLLTAASSSKTSVTLGSFEIVEKYWMGKHWCRFSKACGNNGASSSACSLKRANKLTKNATKYAFLPLQAHQATL